MGLLMMHIHSGSYTGSYFPVYDMNGNVTGMLNSSGALAAWYEYDGFGKKITDGGISGFEDENPIQFSTQFFDDDTGLVYYGFRYYDPSQGRFLNRDPIGEAGGANLYRFVDNDPVQKIDLFGLSPQAYLCFTSEIRPIADRRDARDGSVVIEAIDILWEVVTYSYRCDDPGYGDNNTKGDDFDRGTGGSGSNGGGGGGSGNTTQKEKPDWQKKTLETLCSSEEGRKAVERLNQVKVHAADSISANIEINGTVNSTPAGGFFRASEGAVYLNIGAGSTEYISSKIVHEATHVQQFLDLGLAGFNAMGRTDKEVPAYGTQEQFHMDMGWPAVNEHTRMSTGFLGLGRPAVNFEGIREWQDGINSVGKYLDPTIENLAMNIGGWECPE